MSCYYFIKSKKRKKGDRRYWPRVVPFSDLIMMRNDHRFAIAEVMDGKSFNYKFITKMEKYPDIIEVPKTLRRLLRSAETYPPAMALARMDLERYKFIEDVTMEEYASIFEGFLIKHLESQWKSNYILAEVVVQRNVDNFVGGFSWIVGYTPKINVVHFVSQDEYWIVTDHAANFKLSQEQIARLPIIEMKEYTIIDHANNNRMCRIDLTDESLDFDEISEMIRTIR